MLLLNGMPHIMPAAHAIVNNPVFMNSYPAIHARHKEFVTMPAEFFFLLRT